MGAASAALFFCVGDSDTITVRIRRYTMVKHIILWQFKDALNGYAVHPDHVKIKDGIIAPNVKLRVCIDYKE